MANYLFLAIQLIVFIGLLIGVHDVFFGVDTNKCEMTYMFELPQYIKIKLDKKLQKLYPDYNLFVYSEGHRRSYFQGIPALFILGNAGSYKQVRSLGSVALRMAEDMNKKKFDFFVTDFNEELSALSGGLLERQTSFAHECIKHILSLYKNNQQNSVVVVGHSMGGIVARALYKLVDFDPSTVPVVITQATPHEMPVFSLDVLMKKFYEENDDVWRRMSDEIYLDSKKSNKRDDPHRHRITLVSTGGGPRDIMVRTGLASVQMIGSHHDSLWTSTESIPKAWVSTDHLCHVWCKQVVLATTRALYDVVDQATNQISTNSSLRFEVMKYHFSSNNGRPFYNIKSDDKVKVDKRYEWAVEEIPWKFSGENYRLKYVAFELKQLDEDKEFIAVSNIEEHGWMGACNIRSTSTTCSHLDLLSVKGFLLPSGKSERPFKAVRLSRDDLKNYSHVVLFLPSSSQQMQVSVDIFDLSKNTIVTRVPSLLPLPYDHHHSADRSGDGSMVIIGDGKLSRSSSFYSVVLNDFTNVLQSFNVHLDSKDCKHLGSSVMQFQAPWSSDPTYAVVRNGESQTMKISLSSNRPEHAGKYFSEYAEHQSAELRLYLVSNCSYHLEIVPSPVQAAGQFIRFYLPYVPSFMMTHVVVVLGRQYRTLTRGDSEPFSGFIATLAHLTHYFSIVPLAVAGKCLMRITGLPWLLNNVGLPLSDDFDQLKRHDIWTPIVPVLLFAASIPLVVLLVTACNLISSLLSTVLLFFIKKSNTSQQLHRKLRFPWFLLFFLLSAVTSFFCGALSLLAVSVLALIQVTKSKINKKLGNGFQSSPGFRNSFFILFLLHFLFNAPTLIIWIQNVKSFRYFDDPSFFHSIIASIVFCWLNFVEYFDWLEKYRRTQRKSNLSQLIGGMLHLSGLPLILYATVSMYRISYVVDFILVLVLLHSVFILCFPAATGGESEGDLSSGEGGVELIGDDYGDDEDGRKGSWLAGLLKKKKTD